jgi:restriction system protein
MSEFSLSSPTVSFVEAARSVLTKAGEPLHYKEITQRALAAGLVATTGATPWETLNARLAVDIQRNGARSPFVRIKPGVFALSAWGLTPEGPPDLSARIAHLPTWAALRGFLRAVNGKPREHLTALRGAIRGVRGEGKDFTEPEAWLPQEVPAGPARALGMELWNLSGKTLNPRYVAECASAANRYDLVEEGEDGVLRCTANGNAFMAEPNGTVTRKVDDAEGVTTVLELVAQHGPARAGDLAGPYGEWCARETGIRAEATLRVSLGSRLTNLLDRGLVTRSGQTYEVTPAGLGWLGQEAAAPPKAGEPVPAVTNPEVELYRELAEQRERVIARIRGAVADMHHAAFEHLVKRLLDTMGYSDVNVTGRSGDKGVDVVGKIRVGITPVTEVIQAKRQKGNVQRPVLDALRGSLHRWSAQRGTIITTAAFSQGARDAAFEPGAPPIQLIDGEALVQLLVSYKIGVRMEPVTFWRYDPEPFTTPALAPVSVGGGGEEERDD